MFSLFGKRKGSPTPTAEPTLAQRLVDYRPYRAPHVGRRKQLTVEAARENLSYFESVLPQRLAAAGELLKADAGLDIEPALAAPRAHGLALADALNAWAGERWPALHEPRMALSNDAWVMSRREGEDIAFSMVMDVAVVLGELICRANRDWRWDLDLEPVNLKDKMLTARRVVLLADPIGEMPYPFVKDVEDVVAHRLCHIDRDNKHALRGNPWRLLVDGGQRGTAMAYYRERLHDAGGS